MDLLLVSAALLALKIPWMEELGAGYYPWGCKESGMTERLHFHFLQGQNGPSMEEIILEGQGEGLWHQCPG